MSKTCIAMLLAGGQGSRLYALTQDVAKPGVPFGGKYRIIDFPLSNCSNSGIDTVGVLTQYRPQQLNSYIGSGQPWDLDVDDGGVYILPPYQTAGEKGSWFTGTANAIYQNISFIEHFDPENVLILSGDHIYKMDYGEMLARHIKCGAEATIAVMPVDWSEASRYGIMVTDGDGKITGGDGTADDHGDLKLLGTSNPHYFFGINLEADYKGFDFSMVWGGSAGFKSYLMSVSTNSSSLTTGYAIPDRVAYDHYFFDPNNPSDPRTNTTSKNPRLMVSNSQSTYGSDLWLYDNSFFKLLTLGYTLPTKLTQMASISRLRFFVSGENLFAFTTYPGLDPEMRVQRGYSTMRQYNIGVNVTF